MTYRDFRPTRRITAVVLTSGIVAAWLSACGGDDAGGGAADAGPDAFVTLDSGARDTGSSTNDYDTGALQDGSPPADLDTGTPEDSGPPSGKMDAGADVAAPVDAGHDASIADASDGSIVDAGGSADAADGSSVEASTGNDGGSGEDAGSEDSGSEDSGVDATSEDAGAQDSGADANLCGNGVVDPGEQCDLGASNSDLFSSCSSTCTTTSLLLHLDASNPSGDGTVPDDGTPMAAWVDLATGRSVVQATAAYQPVFRSSAIAGRPAFQFDGVQTTFDADLDINASVLPDVTILVVVQHIAGDTNPYSGIWGADLGGWGRFLSAVGAGESGISNGGGFTFVTGLDTASTPLVSTTILDGSTSNGSTAYVNGVLGATYTGSTNVNDTHLSIGSLNGPNHFIAGYSEYGYIAEVFVYGAALDDADRQTVEGAMMTKY